MEHIADEDEEYFANIENSKIELEGRSDHTVVTTLSGSTTDTQITDATSSATHMIASPQTSENKGIYSDHSTQISDADLYSASDSSADFSDIASEDSYDLDSESYLEYFNSFVDSDCGGEEIHSEPHYSKRQKKENSRVPAKVHSKKQREKRKSSLRHLERVAKQLSEEHHRHVTQSEQMYEQMKTKRSTFAYNLNLSLYYMFGDGYDNIDCCNRLECALAEDVRATIPAIPIARPDHIVRTADEVILLEGLDQFTAFASRMDGFFRSISRLGNNITPRLKLYASIDNNRHVVQESRSNAIFRLVSQNGTLTGDKGEMEVTGAISATFNDHFQISSLEIIFDLCKFQHELNMCFEKSHIERAYGHEVENFLNKERGALEQGLRATSNFDHISTVWDSCSSSSDLKIFGVVMRKSNKLCGCNSKARETLLAAGLNPTDDITVQMSENDSILLKKLSRWHIQSYLYKLIFRDDSGNACYIRSSRDKSVFIQGFPYSDATDSSDRDCMATHVLFVVWRCKMFSQPLYHTLVERLIHRSIEKYTPLLQFENEDNMSCSELLQKHRNTTVPYKTLHSLLLRLSDALQKGEDSCLFLKSFLRIFKSMERRFDKVDDESVNSELESISNKSIHSGSKAYSLKASSSMIYSDPDLFSLPGLDMNEPISLIREASSGASLDQRNDSKAPGSGQTADDDDVEYTSALFEDINAFFLQIANSDLSNQLIVSLVTTSRQEEQGKIEQFIWLCWSKHPNRQIQKLMKMASIQSLRKHLDEALEILDAVIEIDPKYAEAFYKRAIVHFGLRKAHNCFADMDRVLTLNPYHYGALHAKAMMLMKLENYEAAIYAFERAAMINPLLTSSSVGRNMRACKDALQAQQQSQSGIKLV